VVKTILVSLLCLPIALGIASAEEPPAEPESPETGTGKVLRPPLTREADVEPAFFVADGLNSDGSLVKFYKRGLEYAIKYFGNYGPYHVYLLGSDNEESVRAIYRKMKGDK
jgi:hypothetical protein